MFTHVHTCLHMFTHLDTSWHFVDVEFYILFEKDVVVFVFLPLSLPLSFVV